MKSCYEAGNVMGSTTTAISRATIFGVALIATPHHLATPTSELKPASYDCNAHY